MIIKDVHWHKYEAIKCNVELNGKWGYFLGPKKTHIDVVLKESFLLQSQQEPVLIMPEGSLSINDKIMIKNRGWLVQEEDSISTPGVSYYSLSPTTLGKDTIQNNMEKEVYVEEYAPIQAEPKTEDNVILITPDEFYTIATQDGIFVSDGKVDVLSITANEVVFTLPYGVPEAKIVVKQNNQEKEYVFKHKV